MTIGSHQTPIGRSDNRFTPLWIFERLGKFATDAATGVKRPWVIGTERNITPAENCLALDWRSFRRTWLNPPFNKHNVGEFVTRMCQHNHGTMLLHARTDTAWFRPVHRFASAFLWLAGRVVFCYEDGTPCRVENPKSKHYGEIANSGAPVVLISFGDRDTEILHDCGLDGEFQPLRFPRFVLIGMLAKAEEDKTWRAIVLDWLKCQEAPVAVADLYRAFRHHPKAKRNRNWQAKLRQTLARGAGRHIGPDRWAAAA